MPPKRPRTSPKKGTDQCAACGCNLDEESSAMNCDGCNQWLCIDCLEMTEPEYALLTKMTRRIGCEWHCPMCKGDKQARLNASDIQNAITKSLEPLQPALAVIQDLDVKIKDAVKMSFSEFKREVIEDMDRRFQAIETRIDTLEQTSGAAVDQDLLNSLVVSQVQALKSDLDSHLENKMKQLIVEDRDRQRRKLNLVVFGVPAKPEDGQFIQQYLSQEYSLPNISVINPRRLANPNNQTSSNSPIIFSVVNLETKKKILQKSYEKRGTGRIQFRNDVSKADRTKRAKLYEEIQARRANGETDIVIRGGKIVSKNLLPPAPPTQMEL